jgi:branched-chain amino acid transport system substrate-binding protein
MPPLPDTAPAGPVVRVAVLTPMTGELATFGEMVRNGITLAFEEANDAGGVQGHTIEWVLEDTRCDPQTAREAAERVISEWEVRFIVGGVCSEAAVPIARAADERGALFVAATATHPLVTVDSDGAARRLVFRAAFAYPYQARAAAHFALNDLGARRAAVLTNPADSYVRALSDEFAAGFVAGGGRVVITPIYTYTLDGALGDFSPVISQAAQTVPDVFYVPDGYPVANPVGSQVQAQAPGVALIGSELWDNGALSLGAVEGAYFTLHYHPEAAGDKAGAWRERYLSAYAVEPDTLAALGYDAAAVLAAGMAEAEGLSPEAVAQSLEKLEYEGVTGGWRFDAQHNPLKPVVVARIESGHVLVHTTVRP